MKNENTSQQGILKRKNPHGVRVIPGFGLTLGVTVAMLSCLILIPLASLIWYATKLSWSEFVQVVTSRQILSGFAVSLSCSFFAAVINVIFGVILAWILVRYEFPGKGIIDGMIELPFALPTAVAGISLTSLYADQGWIGSIFAKAGIKIAYTKVGITIAMIFVGIPFVVRAVQPVLEKMDQGYEEAAAMLGASRVRTFFKVILPELSPAILAGFGLAFARGIGEYGSVVFIAGNIPFKTQIAPLLIMTKLEQYKYSDATAIALVLLVISFILMFAINTVQIYMQRFSQGADSGSRITKVVEQKDKDSHSWVKVLLIVLGVAFMLIMLVLPLILVISSALKEGWETYIKAVLDEYTIKALQLTLLATVVAVLVNTIFGVVASYLLSKYSFRGRQILATLIDIPFSISPVIAGLVFSLTFGNIGWMGDFLKAHDIKIVFAVPGVILATIFVTFPFVFRELFPVLNAQGRDEEEAAALMGAGGFTIFRRITLPHIRWALLYGIVLCTARAMGEFGAVSVISGHLRGKTNTLPLHVEILYNEFNTTAAFAVSTILMLMAIILLVLRNLVVYFSKKREQN